MQISCKMIIIIINKTQQNNNIIFFMHDPNADFYRVIFQVGYMQNIMQLIMNQLTCDNLFSLFFPPHL